MKTITVTGTTSGSCTTLDGHIRVIVIYPEEKDLIELVLSNKEALSLIANIANGLLGKLIVHPETSNVFSFKKSK